MSSSQIDIDTIEDEALEWLVLLQSSTMTDQQEKAFFTWLHSEPAHQQAFVSAEGLWQRGGALSMASRGARTASKQDYNSGIKGFNWFAPAAGFASVCIVAILFLLVNVDSADQNLEFNTAYGEQKTVELAEGSVITLNTNSDIEVNLNSKNVREVTLFKGEVFFSVSHNADRPFTIKTEEGVIVVLGTKFSVKKEEGKTQVTVVEGKVGLIPDADQWQQQSIAVELTANQQLNLESETLTPLTVDTSKLLSWREGILHFEGETLVYVVSELNRYYSRSIQLGSEELESKLVVAVLPLNNDFDSTLAYLERSLQLSASLAPDGTSIILTSQ